MKGHFATRGEPWSQADKDRVLPVEKFDYGSIANPKQIGNKIVVDDKLVKNIYPMLRSCHGDLFNQLTIGKLSHSLSPA